MNGFIKPLQHLLTQQTVERQIAPGVRLSVRQTRQSIVQGMAHRIHQAWDSLRGRSHSVINLEEYLDRIDHRRAA